MEPTDLPIRDPATFPAAYDRPNASVRGVLLAAGTSSRYGDANKLTETVDGEPIVARAARTLLDSSVDGVTVVVGHEAEAVQAALAGFDVAIRVNEDYQDGQSTSLREGIRDAADRDADAALIALGDMPWVEPESVDLLVEAYRHAVADILAAAFDGKRGNPVLFDGAYFETLTAVTGDTGGRKLLTESNGAVGIETDDPGVRRDVDHPRDL